MMVLMMMVIMMITVSPLLSLSLSCLSSSFNIRSAQKGLLGQIDYKKNPFFEMEDADVLVGF